MAARPVARRDPRRPARPRPAGPAPTRPRPAPPAAGKPAAPPHAPPGRRESGSPARTVTTRTSPGAAAIAAPSEKAASSRCGERTATGPWSRAPPPNPSHPAGRKLRIADGLDARRRAVASVLDHVGDDAVEVERRLPADRVPNLCGRGLAVECVLDPLAVDAVIRNERK